MPPLWQHLLATRKSSMPLRHASALPFDCEEVAGDLCAPPGKHRLFLLSILGVSPSSSGIRRGFTVLLWSEPVVVALLAQDVVGIVGERDHPTTSHVLGLNVLERERCSFRCRGTHLGIAYSRLVADAPQ